MTAVDSTDMLHPYEVLSSWFQVYYACLVRDFVRFYWKSAQKMTIFTDFDDFWNFICRSMEPKIILGIHIMDLELIRADSDEMSPS